jgi:peptidyl-prolyl cis-trans isomerase D
MISWIQRTFQKHFKLVFLLLIAVMVIPMVFIYSASGGLGNTQARSNNIEFFGERFSTDVERSEYARAATLSRMFSQNLLVRRAADRLALKHLADTLGIPQPTAAQLEQFVKSRPAFLGFDGQFDAQRYVQFRDSVRGGMFYGASEAEIQQILREDWRLDQVEKAITGPGYVDETEVKRIFNERETQWSVQTASLDLTSVQATTEPTEAELKNWFESQSFRYEIPEQAVVNYVEYSPAQFLDKVGEPTDDEIVRHFENNKARYQKPPTPAADDTTPPPTETTIGDVRQQVIHDVQQAKAGAEAVRAASEFASYLYDNEIMPDTPAFEDRVKRDNLTIKAAPAFSQDDMPDGLPWNPTIVGAAFRLTEKSPISDVLRATDNSAIVLFYRGRNPKAPLTLEQARDRVVADVKADKRRQAMVARGEELRRQLSTAVAGGQAFADAAKAAGLEVKSWEKFKLSAPPPDIDRAVYQNLSSQKVREVSQMAVIGDRGMFVFATARDLPDPAAAADAYKTVHDMVAQQYAGMGGSIALDEIVRKERVAAGLPAEER